MEKSGDPSKNEQQIYHMFQQSLFWVHNPKEMNKYLEKM